MKYRFRPITGSKHSRKMALRKVPASRQLLCIVVGIQLYGD